MDGRLRGARCNSSCGLALPVTREELDAIYRQYGVLVLGRCRRWLGPGPEAEDALQEIFMRAQRYGRSFKGGSRLAWLYTIADRHCLDRLDLARRRPLAQDGEPDATAGSETPAHDQRILVAGVLRATREEIRKTAILYFVDEMSQEEVAERTGVTRRTVQNRLEKFRKDARRALSRDRRSFE